MAEIFNRSALVGGAAELSPLGRLLSLLLLPAAFVAIAASPQPEDPAWTYLVPEVSAEMVAVPSEELTAAWTECQEVAVGSNRALVEMQVSLIVDVVVSSAGAVERFRLVRPEGKVAELFGRPIAEAATRWRFERSLGDGLSRVSRLVLPKPRGAYRTSVCPGARPNNKLQQTGGKPPAAE